MKQEIEWVPMTSGALPAYDKQVLVKFTSITPPYAGWGIAKLKSTDAEGYNWEIHHCRYGKSFSNSSLTTITHWAKTNIEI